MAIYIYANTLISLKPETNIFKSKCNFRKIPNSCEEEGTIQIIIFMLYKDQALGDLDFCLKGRDQ